MVSPGHSVKEGTIGGTAYRICDDAYRNRTQADIARTLRDAAAAAQRIQAAAQKKTQAQPPAGDGNKALFSECAHKKEEGKPLLQK